MNSFMHAILPEIIHLLEILGVIIIVSGSIKSFVFYIFSMFSKSEYPVKQDLAFSLALGLEYKMGAEILKTVLIRDMQEIWILGSIIILRAILSFLIHFELKEDALKQKRNTKVAPS